MNQDYNLLGDGIWDCVRQKLGYTMKIVMKRIQMRNHTGFGSIVSSDICKISHKSSKRFMVPEVIISKLNQYQKFAFYAHTLLKSFFSSAVLSAP